MPAYAVIGGQWGDEGKGKVIDYLAGQVDSVVRYAGGNNAGHTVVNDKGTFQLHLVPSGICWPDVDGIIGNGVVVDPDVLIGELEGLASRGIDTTRFYVSERAHVVMPYHVMLDRLEEEARGSSAIGTTGRGIGPAYVDKTGRAGIRVGDLLDWDSLAPRLESTLAQKNALITKIYGGEALALHDVAAKCVTWAEQLRPYARPTEQIVQDRLAQGKRVLLEGGPRNAAGLGPRVIPLRHLVLAVHRRRMYRLGPQSPGHIRCAWRIQGLLHAGWQRAHAIGDCRRYGRRDPADRSRIRYDYRPTPAHRLV